MHHDRRTDPTRRSAEQKAPWKKWGPYLSERQWGTVREDYSEGGDAWNYFTPRSGPLARLSLGRRRPGRHLRRQAAALLRAGPVERQGSDPQGTPVRADQQREQSRRGRQGVLLLPRQHADALVHEVPLQVSAGGVPVRRPGRDQPPPRPARVRIRTARHGRVRRGPLLRRVRGVRQGVARRHPDPDHRPQPRPGAGRAARPADALVPQPVVVARAIPTGRRSAQVDGAPGQSVVKAVDPQAGRALPLLRRRRAAAVHGERNQHAADLRRSEPDALRQGQHQRLRRPRPGRRR